MLRGIFFSVMASITFGILYFYAQLLTALSSEQIFGWRLIATLPFLTLTIWMLGDLAQIKAIFLRIVAKPALIFILLLSSVLASFQLWLFLWGPVNGRGLEVSLGYFLLPLVLVMSGSLFYGEKLSKLQLIAVILCALGMAHQMWQQGHIAWETLCVAFGYTAYFLLRKKINTDNLGGFWWDVALILPLAIYFVQKDHGLAVFLELPALYWIVAGLGILSTVGLGSYILASRFLPLILFGLLSYLEPVLLAFAAVMLGERIEGKDLLTYIPIWCAVLLIIIEGILHLYRQQKNKRRLALNIKEFEKRATNDQ